MPPRRFRSKTAPTDAAAVLAATGVKLVGGDSGSPMFRATPPHQIAGWARPITLPLFRICFSAPGATGFLALTVADTFRIMVEPGGPVGQPRVDPVPRLRDRLAMVRRGGAGDDGSSGQVSGLAKRNSGPRFGGRPPLGS